MPIQKGKERTLRFSFVKHKILGRARESETKGFIPNKKYVCVKKGEKEVTVESTREREKEKGGKKLEPRITRMKKIFNSLGRGHYVQTGTWKALEKTAKPAF